MRMNRWTLGVVLAAACGGGGERAPGEQAVQDVALPPGPDPCSLVSAAEAETVMGPLAEPPFRVDRNREPAVDGEWCFYRARDRRNVAVLVDWEEGEQQFEMLAGTGQAITDILAGYDPATDTLEGEWDRVGAPMGQFIALKGKTAVWVDPLGARIGLGGAARLTTLALRRVGAPLDYSGARATLARAAEPPRSRNPCELVTRAEVEALMGPLKADPHPSEDGTECEFPTIQELFGSPVTRSLKVTWTDGFYAFGQERQGVAGGTRIMAAQVEADLPTLSREAAGEAEPWDERITLLGGLITVVKADVMLQTAGDGVAGFDEAKALALLRIAAGRL